MLQRLRIGTRLVLAFTLLLVLLLAVAAVTLSRLQQLSVTTSRVVSVQMQKQAWSQHANQQALMAANRLLELLQTRDRQLRVTLYRQMDQALAKTDTAIKQLDRLLNHNGLGGMPTEKSVLRRIIQLRQDYRDHFLDTVNLIELSGPEVARLQFEAQTSQSLQVLLAEIGLFSSWQQNYLQQQLEQLQQEESIARTVVVILSLGALILGAVLAWRINRSITQPVRKAVTVANAITRGELLHALPEGGQDEVGQLLNAMHVMRDAIASREAYILNLAYTDELTALPNRTRLLEAVQQQPPQTAGALLVFDIDRFSLINQSLGEDVGDRLLVELGWRLAKLLDAGQLLVRLWCDQFAFWLPQGTEEQVAQLIARLKQFQQQAIIVDGQRMDVEAKMGIAYYPGDGASGTLLLRNAVLALRQAKSHRLTAVYFSQTAGEPLYEKLSLIGEMREALALNQFVVYYQPKFSPASGRMTSAEALLRWQHPQRGMIAPGAFIPFAEQTGFIREITPWLINQVLAQTAQWRQQGFTVVPAINLSVHDLVNEQLPLQLQSTLARYGLLATDLSLEITESALMEEPEIALKTLESLAALGITMSIDDYGTGQASLSYLKSLPVHELKIDRMFVDQVASLATNSAIVASTIQLAHALGMSVVAEGAETLAEFSWLCRQGCDYVQGYVVAKPMSATELSRWEAPAELLASITSLENSRLA